MILFYYLLFINSVAFVFVGIDKYFAVKKKHRIPEKIVFAFILSGGTFGAVAAMYLYKHKTSKRSFLLKFYSIAILQVIIAFCILFRHSNYLQAILSTLF